MSTLIVRNVDRRIVKALEARAADRGTDPETEHREILRRELLGAGDRSFVALLAAMPNVGRDEDFRRRNC